MNKVDHFRMFYGEVSVLFIRCGNVFAFCARDDGFEIIDSDWMEYGGEKITDIQILNCFMMLAQKFLGNLEGKFATIEHPFVKEVKQNFIIKFTDK